MVWANKHQWIKPRNSWMIGSKSLDLLMRYEKSDMYQPQLNVGGYKTKPQCHFLEMVLSCT